MADEDETRWTVRGVPKAYRERAAEAASRRKVTLGTYVCQALDLMLRTEREPLAALLPLADKTADMTEDARLARIERIVASVVALASTRGVPAETRKQANRLLREALPQPATDVMPAGRPSSEGRAVRTMLADGAARPTDRSG
jgi:hypothetical protein